MGIDASQLYPFARTKELPTGPYTKWELKEDNRFHPNKLRRSHFEELVLEFLQSKRPECSIQTQFNAKQKKLGRFAVDGFCSHCSTVFEAMGCFYHFCHCQEKRRLLLEDIEKGVKRRQSDAFQRRFLRSQGLNIVEVRECQWWKTVKSNEERAKDFMEKNHPFVPPLSESSLIHRIRQENMFGVLDCTMEVPVELRQQFADFPPIFKNSEVCREDIGSHMRTFAQTNNLLKKPTRMLVSSSKLERGPIITPLLNFYLEKGLVIKKVHWFLQYKPRKTFEGFVSSVVQARRKGDENKDSSVVAETMKLIANSSYGYQIMDRSKHTNTKFVLGSDVDSLVNNCMFKRLHHLPRKIFEVELGKRKIEHKEPIIVGFFLLQYAKLILLPLYYNFFKIFCDESKFELIEMDTDSLYMAISEKNIEEIIKPEMKKLWQNCRWGDCSEKEFKADGRFNFFPRNCCSLHNKYDQRTPGLFKEEFRCTGMVALCSKTYCCYDEVSETVKLSCKGINKSTLKDDNPMLKMRNVLQKQDEVTTTNRGFRVVNQKEICTYELKKTRSLLLLPEKRSARRWDSHQITRYLTIVLIHSLCSCSRNYSTFDVHSFYIIIF